MKAIIQIELNDDTALSSVWRSLADHPNVEGWTLYEEACEDD